MSSSFGSGNIDDGRPAWPKDEHGKKDLPADDEWHYERLDRSYAYSIKMIRVIENGERTKTYKTFRKNLLDFSERLEPDQKVDEFEGQGEEPSIPYRLPELVEARAANPDVLVLILEGERDVETARTLGFVATTNPHGAEKWKDEYAIYLKGGNAVVIPDNDERGKKHADQVGVSVVKVASRLRVVDLAGTPLHGDLTYWVDYRRKTGMTDEAIAADLRKLIDAAPDLDKWRERHGRLARDKSGVPLRTVGNLSKVLAMMGVKLSYDDFNLAMMVEGLTGYGPVLDDHALRYLRVTIGTDYGIRFYKDDFSELVQFLAHKNRFHPVIDYLDALSWDGVPRLDTWLIDLAGAPDTDYVRAVSRIVLVAAVRRVRVPGTKFDEMLILESPQGKEKSTAINILAVRDEWFLDNLPLSADSKVVIELTSGAWIVEASELNGMKTRDADRLKGFLSRRKEKARLSYDRLLTVAGRQFIIIGTTNEDEYLVDMTGDRRFWPVRIAGFDIEKLREVRDQLWAEAVAREKAGESIRLDRGLWGAAAEEQEARRHEEPWVAMVGGELGDIKGRVMVNDLLEIVGVPMKDRTAYHTDRMGKVMRALGWSRDKQRFEGFKNPQRCYWRGEKGQKASEVSQITIERHWDAKSSSTALTVKREEKEVEKDM